jgi:hypothetical protein
LIANDRDAGFAAVDRTLGKINQRYVRTKLNVGPIDPITRVSKQALVDKSVTQIAEAAVHERPDEMQVIFSRLQTRTPVG